MRTFQRLNKDNLWHLATLPFKMYIALTPCAFFLITAVGLSTGGLITGIGNNAIAREYARVMLPIEYGYFPCLLAVLIDTWRAAHKQDRRGLRFGVILLVIGVLSLGFFHALAHPARASFGV